VRRREKRKRLFPFHACRMRRPFISGNGATVIHKPNNPDSTKLAKATPPPSGPALVFIYTIPGNDSSLGFQRGLVFQGRSATKMVIGDPKNVYKDQDPATGSFNGLHPESKFLAIGGIPSTQQPLVARRATHLPSVFIRVRSS
jgi:hypothetical protein